MASKNGARAWRANSATSFSDKRPPSVIALTVSEITQSVRTLYADELKPYGRVVLKRMRERAAAKAALSAGLEEGAIDPETMPRIDPRRLRRACESCGMLIVEPEEAKEYSVRLVRVPDTFLDICSTEDSYPQEFWSDFENYLSSLDRNTMILPGGRYACARVLVGRGLPFLQGLSLGRVCHAMQLAISRRKLLGYLDGSLVPYKYSEGWIKEQCALNQSATGTGVLPVATWEEARTLLSELLDSEANPAPGMITISNVKRLFRSRFQLELSETVFGFTKLFDLLSDRNFHDVCTLLVRGNGQVIVKRVRSAPAIPPGMWGPFPMMPVPMLSLPDDNVVPGADIAQTQELISPGASPRASPRGLSGRGLSSMAWSEAGSLHGKSSSTGQATAEGSWDSSSNSSLNDDAASATLSDFMPIPSHEICISVKNTFIEVAGAEDIAQHSSRKQRSRSVPKDLGSIRKQPAVPASSSSRQDEAKVLQPNPCIASVQDDHSNRVSDRSCYVSDEGYDPRWGNSSNWIYDGCTQFWMPDNDGGVWMFAG